MMRLSPSTVRRLAVPCVVVAALTACSTPGTVVTSEGAKPSIFSKLPFTKGDESAASADASPKPPEPAKPQSPPGPVPAVSKVTVEVQCKTPVENYDFG